MFLLLIIIGSVKSLVDKTGKLENLTRMQQEFILQKNGRRNNSNTSLLRLYERTETEDRAVTVKEDDHSAC